VDYRHEVLMPGRLADVRASGQERMADLEALLSATTPDELHHVLVLGWPAAVVREPSAPLSWLRRVHRESPADIETTAVLLVTDVRCRSIGAELLAGLEKTGQLSAEVLDLLAETFVSADEFVYWECPDEWFQDGVLVLLDPSGSDAGPDDEDEDQQESGPAVVRRRVPDGARRWAAARMVRSQPKRWAAVYRRSRQTTKPIGAALLHGLLDATDVLTDPAADLIESLALRSGDAGLRLAGLKRRALSNPEQARLLARGDGNARVRDRAESLGPSSTTDDEIDLRTREVVNPSGRSAGSSEAEPTLF